MSVMVRPGMVPAAGHRRMVRMEQGEMTMGHITEQHVEEMNDRIAQASTTAEAFGILGNLTRRMVDLLLDLNGVDVDGLTGTGLMVRREMVGAAHGWDWNEADDDRPADGFGPCSGGRFEAHSRRPLQCRFCRRRKLDHRPVA